MTMQSAPMTVPVRLTARPLAVLPASLHGSGPPSRWIEIERHGSVTTSFLEGPVVQPDGSLLVCDVAWGRIFHVSTRGGFEVVCRYDGAPNGLARDASGVIWIADFLCGILRWTPGDDEPQVVLSGPSLEPFKGVNDLCFGPDGWLYFTDQGETGLHDPSGRLYRWHPDNGLHVLVSGIPAPNGLCLPSPGDALVAATRDNSVWRVPFNERGDVRKVGRFLSLSGGAGPDGMAVNGEGLIAVAHLGLGAVWIFDAVGEIVARIDSPTGRSTTNVAFAPDQRTVFITEAETGTVLVAELPSRLNGRPGS